MYLKKRKKKQRLWDSEKDAPKTWYQKPKKKLRIKLWYPAVSLGESILLISSQHLVHVCLKSIMCKYLTP